MTKVSEVYKKLFHYTTWEGLIGILDSKNMWATNYKSLNDYSEINLFRDKLVSLVLPYSNEIVNKILQKFPKSIDGINKKGGIEKVIRHEAESLVDAHYSALGDDIYILSFCGEHSSDAINENGLLSQWRGYGSGGGAAIIFDTEQLEKIMDTESIQYEYSAMYIADVVYSDDENKFNEEISKDLTVIADVVKNIFNFDTFFNKKHVDASKAYHPFVRCISRYKHYGFSEENEVRVIALPTIINEEIERLANNDGVKLRPEKEVKIRKKCDQEVKYIELFNSDDIELPIDKIIIGPHAEKEARLKMLNKRLGKGNIKITCSDIPFICQ